MNEVVQKVYGGEKPVPLWFEDSDDSSSSSTVKQILFTLVIRVKVKWQIQFMIITFSRNNRIWNYLVFMEHNFILIKAVMLKQQWTVWTSANNNLSNPINNSLLTFPVTFLLFFIVKHLVWFKKEPTENQK